MFLSLFAKSPIIGVAWVIAIMMSLTVHEFSHALVGKLRGDDTAEREGRLTLNPLAHIDWLGVLPLLLLGFGWAKPVPYNPYNLKNPKWDAVLIGLAGPFSNLIMAVASAVVLRVLWQVGGAGDISLLMVFLIFLVILNLFLMFFNIIPVHPLDGSKLFSAIFSAPRFALLRAAVSVYGPRALLLMVIISFLTPFNIFFFVSAPAYALCGVLLGGNCISFLSIIFLQ